MTLGEAKLRDLPRIGLNAALVLCAGMSGCARSGELGVPVEPDRKASADRRASRSRDLPFTTTLNLEVIEAGQDAERGKLTICNPSNHPWEIVRVETSCPCLNVSPVSLTIEPRSSAILTVAFDPTEEPDFRGRLAVRVKGVDASDTIVFEARVNLEVRSPQVRSRP